VTALVEADRARLPVLVVAGDTAVDDRDNLQNIDQREVVLATGATFVAVRTPDTLGADLAEAARRAVETRRPVVLNVPVDFQWTQVTHEPLTPPWRAPQAVAADDDSLDRAVGIVASARRPIVLAGRGAATPGARKALLALADRIGAPVATTLRARDLFRGEPHDLGIFGELSHPVALDTIVRADCVIAFGASLNRWTSDGGALLEGKHVVQVDLDPTSLLAPRTVAAAVHGDAERVAVQLLQWLEEAEVSARSFASAEPAARLAQHSPTVADGVGLTMPAALDLLERAFPGERTLVLDGGRFIHHALRRLRVPHPSAYVHTVNFGSIGLGLAAALGAAVAAPRPVLLVTGDGGFMLGGLAEFSTAVRHELDLVVVVLNDGAYGAEHIQLVRKGMDPAISTFDWPDLGPVATALGGEGHTVRSVAALEAALARLTDRTRPVLIDIRLDPDTVPPAS
jgi:thiamine pyrophosphate-dependent acetolactate synthase large subunit-like protein